MELLLGLFIMLGFWWNREPAVSSAVDPRLGPFWWLVDALSNVCVLLWCKWSTSKWYDSPFCIVVVVVDPMAECVVGSSNTTTMHHPIKMRLASCAAPRSKLSEPTMKLCTRRQIETMSKKIRHSYQRTARQSALDPSSWMLRVHVTDCKQAASNAVFVAVCVVVLCCWLIDIQLVQTRVW
jgi:hypothetical protein